VKKHISAAGKGFQLSNTMRHSGLILMSIIAIAPMLWIAFLSFKTRRDFAANPFGLPKSLNLENYVKVLTDDRMVVFITNSVIVTTTTVVIILIVSILAAYGLARIDFRGNRFLFVLFFLSDAIPVFVVLVPLFILVHRIGLGGTRWSLIFPYSAMHIGISIFILRAFFRGIPRELEDAAAIDGCNTLQMLWFIMLPLIRPAVIVVTIVSFVRIWNEYYLAAILLPSQKLFTLPPGLAATFRGKYATDWPAMSAGIILSILPVVVIFILGQDKIIQGWSAQQK